MTRIAAVVLVGVAFCCSIVFAQRNTSQPQPQAGRLAPVAVPGVNRGALVEKPAGVMPTVPAGFTVSVYAEVPAPRMMVYAPNGDLFVSSPASNNITVLRDANNDGVFESRSVFAQGEVAARRGGGGGAAGGQRQGGPPPAAPAPAVP